MTISYRQIELIPILRDLFPKEKIIEEYVLADGLRLDCYMPGLNLAIEIDGIQHRKNISFFFANKSEFYANQNRDRKKEYFCKTLGINLIRISDTEKITIDLIKSKYDEIGPGTGIILDESSLSKKAIAKQWKKDADKKRYAEYKQSESYRLKKKLAREQHKIAYKKMKENKNE